MRALVSTTFALIKKAISTEKTIFKNKNTEKLKGLSNHFMKNKCTGTSFSKLILRSVKIIYLNINFVNKKGVVSLRLLQSFTLPLMTLRIFSKPLHGL